LKTPKLLLNRNERNQYGYFQFLDHFLGRNIGFKLTNNSRERFYNGLKGKFSSLPKGEFIPVERIKNIDLDTFYKNYVIPGIPVVLENAAKEWNCVKDWSLQYFKDLHGDDEIIAVEQDTMDLNHKKLTLADIIDGIQQGMGKYYRFYPLLDKHPEHLTDFDVKWLRTFKKAYSPTESFQVFIGGDKSYTPLHNASLGNLFIQAVGKKHWRFYPNELVSIIDPDPVRNIYRHAPVRKEGKSFDAFKPDFEHPFHLFEKLNGFEVILNPGDILYNPPYYWHTVRNIGDSIGIGYRWLPLCHNLKKWPLHTLMDLTARKPNFFKTMKYLKQDVNLLHLAETGELKTYLKNK
jgi:hypothetical protein